MSTLSTRGLKLTESPARADMEVFDEAMQDLYHLTDNPTGKIALNIAENHPMTATIRAKLHAAMMKQDIPDWVSNYTSANGHPEVLEALSNFMNRQWGTQHINSENISLSAGVSAVLEVMAFVLCNPGDTVLIPAPAYPMYTHDLGLKSGVKRFNLQTSTEEGIPNLNLLTVKELAAAKSESENQGETLKMVLLTSPDNPTGKTYRKEQLEAIAEWCMTEEVHLVVNEIYHFSVIAGIELPTSFTKIMESKNSPYLHHIYGMSKDFAMSGLRVGVFHSLNTLAIQAIANANIPHMVSNLTQWALGEMFADEAFIDEYIRDHRASLKMNRDVVVQGLDDQNIPYVDGTGSLFIWADFCRFLKNNTPEGEKQLWRNIYHNTGVLLTPGVGFGHNSFGWFRIVYTSVDRDSLIVAMSRIADFLQSLDD